MSETSIIIAGLGRKKDEFREEFRKIKSQIDQLEQRLQHIKAKLAYTDDMIAEFKAEESKLAQGTPAFASLGRYAGMGTSEAARDYFKRNPERWFDAGEVGDALKSEGLESSSANFRNALFVTLKRLSEMGELIETIQNGQRVFRWNQSKEKADLAQGKVG